MSQLTSILSNIQPAFSVAPAEITILSHPNQFHALLLEMVRSAQSRIFISSLYIGSADPTVIAALAEALRSKPPLQLYLQLDLNRSTRPGNSSTATLLLPLLHDFPMRVHVSLFRSPSLRGVLAKLVPPRFNEGWGTWHPKIYAVDDQVMISGANLNKSYFTNRQDRYIHFNHPALSQYCFDFMQTVSTFSFRLLPPTSSVTNQYSYRHENYILHWPDPHVHPHYIHQKAQTALSQFQASYRRAPSEHQLISSGPLQNPPHSDPDNVSVFPIIQAGQFNIREEEATLALIFRLFNSPTVLPATESAQSPTPLVDMTSGYFALYKPYQDLVLASENIRTRIIAASPKANGFYGSSGISARIPEAYTLLEQRFMMAVKSAARISSARGVQLSEWEKEAWSYHAKGLWLSPTPSSLPVLTLFGSTNLNSRSAHIDTELSFVMVLPEPQSPAPPCPSEGTSKNLSPLISLRHQLAAEINGLRSNTVQWRGGQRKVRLWTKLLVRLVKGML